jgi:hypothetical protein
MFHTQRKIKRRKIWDTNGAASAVDDAVLIWNMKIILLSMHIHFPSFSPDSIKNERGKKKTISEMFAGNSLA